MSDVQSQLSMNNFEEIKQLDDLKIGIKGLVDSGISKIPPFFIQPPEKTPPSTFSIPIVDLLTAHKDLIKEVANASREFGMFQVVNHGVSVETMESTINAIKSFHELPSVEKRVWYSRDHSKTFGWFFSTLDLFHSKAPYWRDTFRVGQTENETELEIPEACKNEVIKWRQQVKKVGEVLLKLLSEGLGLDGGRLKETKCLEAISMACHYYPFCPQSDLAIGTSTHTDPLLLTVLLQDQMGGLQVKQGGTWVDVNPVPGALVVNIGDILQIISNDEYRSVEHRVLANPSPNPRISVAAFLIPSMEANHGPLPELISAAKPALYKEFTVAELLRSFYSGDLNCKPLTSKYKLQNKE